SRGNRPGFSASAPYETAHEIYNQFVDRLRSSSPLVVQTGVFGRDMQVSLTNDGPVTMILDTP
ncbi:MAG: D-aminoacyl-tRNA deacylase, partial [Prosthecochloris sp.]